MDISAKHAKGELPNVRLGSWLCENAKTLNRDRRTCSSKTVLVAQRASGFNLEIDLKNIILRRVSIFEFLHSQGQKLASIGATGGVRWAPTNGHAGISGYSFTVPGCLPSGGSLECRQRNDDTQIA